MAEIAGIPGFSRLIDDYRGEPALLRWLSIHSDGRVVECASDNDIAWSVAHDGWVQWRLVWDVYREIDPALRFNLSGAKSIPTDHGVVITAEPGIAPVNPVASGMLAELGVEHEAHGTVAWLGDRHPETGLHGDLDNDQRTALLAMAERHKAGS